ncbi:MAG: phage tail protein [Lachnospiraceae bacterium]
MDLKNMDFIRMLPAFMQMDAANISLAGSIDTVAEELYSKIILFSTWDKIDLLKSDELDMLAEELHISWYDKTAAIDVRRNIIRESDLVHAKLGTNWAAKQVINKYFGEGEIIDWYTYGGEPGHFKIQTLNQSILKDKYEQFIGILDKVKRKSAQIDSIELILDGLMEVRTYLAHTNSELMTTYVRR